VLGVALPHALVGQVSHFVGAAARAAGDTVRPADGLNRLPAVLVVREEQDGLLKGGGLCGAGRDV
jgi:hypothetical protein